MMISIQTVLRSLIVGLVLSILSTPAAHAYFSPEDVLLNKELYLPPSARDASDRAQRQASEAAERREREQDALFEAQRPLEPEDSFYLYEEGYFEEGDPLYHDAAPAESIATTPSAVDVELARTLRLLDRLEERQRIMRYGGGQLHAGAPLAPLAPTGAGGILVGITMIASVLWTVQRARKAEEGTHMVP